VNHRRGFPGGSGVSRVTGWQRHRKRDEPQSAGADLRLIHRRTSTRATCWSRRSRSAMTSPWWHMMPRSFLVYRASAVEDWAAGW